MKGILRYSTRSFRMAVLALILGLPVAGAIFDRTAQAQNTVSGDLQGSVTDPTGAAIPGAAVTLQGLATGSINKDVSGGAGAYHISLVKPGSYKLTVTAPGFDTLSRTIVISQGVVTSGDVKLELGQASTVIEVAADVVPMLNTEDAQLSTSFDLEQVQNLPNPGGDLTFYAQTAPGVVMNTAQGDGLFSVFGLPGTSNNFTVNGEQENDPFLNLNNSGPTNLLLGQNDISSVSILTTAYGAEFGSFGGAQVNEISRSGSNRFHGDASYWWNGRTLNSNDWFLKAGEIQDGLPKSNFFSNANQWAASVSGPIVKDKTFFFIDTEGIRFITAPADHVDIPNAAYEYGTVAAPGALGADGACDDASSTLFRNGNGAECAYYKQIFALYAGAPGAKTAVADPLDPFANFFIATPQIFAKESLVTFRVDQVLGPKDTMFAHFKYDNGTQPSVVDPINSAFNDISNQPEDEGQLVETHVFSPNLINQFLMTGAHYGALFQNVNQAALPSLFNGGTLDFNAGDGVFANLGSDDFAFPEGRNATQYQFADDLAWTRKAHTLKFGYAFKKDDISDFDGQIEAQNPLQVTLGNPGYGGASFQAGNAFVAIQSFPQNFSNGVNLYSEGFYAQDTYKANPHLTVTYGIRLEHNSNPVCPHGCFSHLSTSVDSYFASTTSQNASAPYDSLVDAHQTAAFTGYQSISYEPRFEFAYSVSPKTVLRGGFGMFSDVFPGQVGDELIGNSPQEDNFAVYYSPIDPALPGSGSATAVALNNAFQHGTSNFYNGGSLSTITADAGGAALLSSPPNLFTGRPNIHYPTYEEYSLQVQHAVTPTTTIQFAYAGNHGYHEPVIDGSRNAYNPCAGVGPACGPAGSFGGLPGTAPSAGFGQITEVSSSASSNYNGGLVSIVHHSKHVNAQINYTYSHTLDQVSNGGFLPFNATSSISSPLIPGNLSANYGNADYDVRHSLNGNYLVNLPGYGSQHLRMITDGWQISGNAFYRAGLPFTVTDSNINASFANYTGAIPAQLLTRSINRHCNQAAAYTTSPCLGETATPATDSFSTQFTDPTNFIPLQRNQFTGPHYFNTDMSLNKAVKLPSENAKLILGVNGYNVLNHPNFANPISNIGNPQFGSITSTVGVPTSIYGSGLGGDASVRILQLHAKVSF